MFEEMQPERLLDILDIILIDIDDKNKINLKINNEEEVIRLTDLLSIIHIPYSDV